MILLAGVFVVAAIGLTVVFAKQPRNDRDWAEQFTRLAQFTPQGDGTLHLANLRDWQFDASGAIDKQWRQTQLNPQDATALWFYLDLFPGSDSLAHTMLSFEFATPDGPRYVILSVEVRKRNSQSYSALRGIFRTYELIHIWSSERDALTDRALARGEALYGYRLNLEPAQVVNVFNAFVAETNDLVDKPRFYNTLTTNCTSALAAIVNKARPGAIPWDWSFLLTGYADRYLHKLGYIGAPGDTFEALRAAAKLNARIAKAATSADSALFSQHLHRSL